jgi:hypothetical protein
MDESNLMKMTKNELVEMIRQEVRALAYETLRNKSKVEKERENKTFKPKGLTEDELEVVLFHGGREPEEKDISKILPVTIKESYDNGLPKIQSSEVTAFEDSLEKMMQEVDGASVVFDKQSNGYSLKMWIGPNGIEAGASGKIQMGNKGTINWAYSLQNGLTVSTEDLSVDKGNRIVLEKLFNNYNSWQKEWREKLTIQPGKDNPEEATPMAPPAEMSGAEGDIPAA